MEFWISFIQEKFQILKNFMSVTHTMLHNPILKLQLYLLVLMHAWLKRRIHMSSFFGSKSSLTELITTTSFVLTELIFYLHKLQTFLIHDKTHDSRLILLLDSLTVVPDKLQQGTTQ